MKREINNLNSRMFFESTEGGSSLMDGYRIERDFCTDLDMESEFFFNWQLGETNWECARNSKCM